MQFCFCVQRKGGSTPRNSYNKNRFKVYKYVNIVSINVALTIQYKSSLERTSCLK